MAESLGGTQREKAGNFTPFTVSRPAGLSWWRALLRTITEKKKHNAHNETWTYTPITLNPARLALSVCVGLSVLGCTLMNIRALPDYDSRFYVAFHGCAFSLWRLRDSHMAGIRFEPVMCLLSVNLTCFCRVLTSINRFMLLLAIKINTIYRFTLC